MDAGRVPAGSDRFRAGRPTVSQLRQLPEGVRRRRQTRRRRVHHQRGGRVRREGRAVGPGHGHDEHVAQTRAPRSLPADQHQPVHGHRDPGYRSVRGHVAGQPAGTPGGAAHRLRPSTRVRVGRRTSLYCRVRRGRGSPAHDPAAGDDIVGAPPARRVGHGGRRQGRQELRVLHVPAERQRVFVGHVVS